MRNHAIERLIVDHLPEHPVLDVKEAMALIKRSGVSVSAAFATVTELAIIPQTHSSRARL
jgi:hypothetical protein